MDVLRALGKLICTDEMKNVGEMSKAVLAEFFGTGFLVLLGCGSWIKEGRDDPKNNASDPSMIHIALAFGVTAATVIHCIGSISGGHINPTVTLAMMATGKSSVLRSLFYIISQCVGAIVGAGFLELFTPEVLQGELGRTKLGLEVTSAQGLCIEFCISFFFIFSVFAASDGNKSDFKLSAPLAVGLSLTACHCFAIKYTGASMNAARSLGPAVVIGKWEDHWIYWLGPAMGGIAAAVVYHGFVFPPPPNQKANPVKEETDRLNTRQIPEQDTEERYYH